MKTITIELKCGETTCSDISAEFCQFLRTSRLGQVWHCGLFHGPDQSFHETGDSIQRLPECLTLEK